MWNLSAIEFKAAQMVREQRYRNDEGCDYAFIEHVSDGDLGIGRRGAA